MLLPSYIQDCFRRWADHEERCANWDESHKHESGTQAEWDTRTENNRNRFKLARALRHAGRFYVEINQ